MARPLVQYPVLRGFRRDERIFGAVVGKTSTREVFANRAVIAGLEPCPAKKAAAEVCTLALLFNVVLVKQFIVAHDYHAKNCVVETNFCKMRHVIPQNVIEPEPVNL